jgi:choline dehydrogenase-like flavoprotein
VVNPDLKAWEFENLYIGGNSVLEGNFAANPTLTSMALAVKSACAIASGLRVVV